MKTRLLLVIALSLLFVSVVAAQGQKPLTNDDVVQMVKGGFDESTTVTAIESAPNTDFDTSV